MKATMEYTTFTFSEHTLT